MVSAARSLQRHKNEGNIQIKTQHKNSSLKTLTKIMTVSTNNRFCETDWKSAELKQSKAKQKLRHRPKPLCPSNNKKRYVGYICTIIQRCKSSMLDRLLLPIPVRLTL